jgi:hypothetical protein
VGLWPELCSVVPWGKKPGCWLGLRIVLFEHLKCAMQGAHSRAVWRDEMENTSEETCDLLSVDSRCKKERRSAGMRRLHRSGRGCGLAQAGGKTGS